MEFRLAGKGRFEFEIEGKAGHQQIVPLLFVSFIENSIEHGLVSTSKEGYVKGRIRIEPNMLEFYLENNYDPDWAGRPQPFKTGAGLGLKNIRRQLALHYPEWRHGLEIEDEGGVFVVRLWVRF